MTEPFLDYLELDPIEIARLGFAYFAPETPSVEFTSKQVRLFYRTVLYSLASFTLPVLLYRIFLTASVADPDPGYRIRCLFDPWIPNPYFLELIDNFLGKMFYNSLKIGPNFSEILDPGWVKIRIRSPG
jgi:hypothetical protein